jgi:DNA adenine methylase
MKPILKWTGGKSSEIPEIKERMPSTYNRYVEPFLGGGAIFFEFEKNNSIVNDFNTELIQFYSLLNNQSEYAIFETIIKQAHLERLTVNGLDFLDLSVPEIDTLVKNISTEPEYKKFLERELKSKTKTIARINDQNLSNALPPLTSIEVATQYTTAVNAALYYSYRSKYNAKNIAHVYDVEHLAYWFIMRELAYSGMFRFGKNGQFNIPYGGISYNSKNLLTKLDRIHAIQQTEFYGTTEFNNLDFEEFFNKYDYFTEDDFIFLDPPYDSTFSQYNKDQDFTHTDQVRLRDVLLKTKAKCMVVIKDTDYIRSLYAKDFKIGTITKTYTVNFRKERNDKNKEVIHLYITNY